MKTQVGITLALLAGFQVVSGGFFDNVEPMSPKLPITPSLLNNGPLKEIFDVVDKSLADPHIVGGKEAVPNSHPHQVALKLKIKGRDAFCGGSLISDQWVLTAAHCTDNVESITVVLGAHNITADEPTARYVSVAKTVVHYRWNRWLVQNDIALLQLDHSVTLDGKYVNTIRLPALSQKEDSFWRKDVTMTGWGKDSDKSSTVSPVLREVDSYIVSNFYCSFRYFFGLVKDTHICASGWWLKSFGTCNGDSGGPMYVKEADGGKTLIGITSFGIAFGCEWTWPPVFTRVTSYLDWIHKTTGIPPRP